VEKLKTLLRSLFFLAMAATTVWTFLVPDAANFQYPAMARIFFWHFPCPMMLLTFMFAGVWFSFRAFRRVTLKGFDLVDDIHETRVWDVRAESAMELGFLYGILTMITGILFSLVQWGALWQWDPRQSSFLLALLIYGAYFALRAAISDEEKRASYAAAYALSSALPVLFLVLVFPHLPQVAAASFHPSDTIMGGQLKGQYGYVTIVMLTLITILSVWLYRLRSTASLLELEFYEHDRTLEVSRSSSTATGVVRPVSVPVEGGGTTEAS
jgi:heme exporter protein C